MIVGAGDCIRWCVLIVCWRWGICFDVYMVFGLSFVLGGLCYLFLVGRLGVWFD